jgi:hypothetical protein
LAAGDEVVGESIEWPAHVVAAPGANGRCVSGAFADSLELEPMKERVDNATDFVCKSRFSQCPFYFK